MNPISQDTHALEVSIQATRQAEKEMVFKHIGGGRDFDFYNTTQLEKPWDHWVKSWPSVSNLSSGWFSQHQQQSETLMIPLRSCISWIALVFKQIYSTINAWLKDRIVSLAPMWLDDSLKKSALWGQPSWRRGRLGSCRRKCCRSSRGGTSSSPLHGSWGWCSAIKSLVPLLSLDPAGNDRASHPTAFLYLNGHTPKSYFQKQCEHLWELSPNENYFLQVVLNLFCTFTVVCWPLLCSISGKSFYPAADSLSAEHSSSGS